MSNTDLEQLTRLAKKALRAPHILHMIKLLEAKILESRERFTWKVLSEKLPEYEYENWKGEIDRHCP